MRKELYTSLREKLLNTQGVKHVALWNLQVEFLEQEAPFDLPAVFIEFDPISWKESGNGVQTATSSVKLHIISRYEVDNDNIEVLEYFDLLELIRTQLHGMTGNKFKQLRRTASYTNHNHEQLIETIEEYSYFAINTLH